MKKIGVFNCSSHYGQQILQTILAKDNLELAGGTVRSSNAYLGKDIGQLIGQEKIGQLISDDLEALAAKADAVIDFSHRDAVEAHIKACLAHKTALVIGTTALEDKHYALLNAAAQEMPILHSHNMSIGITFLTEFTKTLSSKLKEFDIEILDFHHARKKDAPSGTALSIGKAAAEARGEDFDDVLVRARSNHNEPRKQGEIGFASLRGGNVVATHSVTFAGQNEHIELIHRADNPRLFSEGAVLAACWLQQQKPGLYSMQDVFL